MLPNFLLNSVNNLKAHTTIKKAFLARLFIDSSITEFFYVPLTENDMATTFNSKHLLGNLNDAYEIHYV